MIQYIGVGTSGQTAFDEVFDLDNIVIVRSFAAHNVALTDDFAIADDIAPCRIEICPDG